MFKNMSKREKRKILWSYLFLTPQLILYLTLTILPLFIALPIIFSDRLTFTDRDWEYVGLDNLYQVVNDDTLRETYTAALGRTLRFTGLNYLMVYTFGLTLAVITFIPFIRLLGRCGHRKRQGERQRNRNQ